MALGQCLNQVSVSSFWNLWKSLQEMCLISSLTVWQNSAVNPFRLCDVYFEKLLITNSISLQDVCPLVNISCMNFSRCSSKCQSNSSEFLKTYGETIIHDIFTLSSDHGIYTNVTSSSSSIRFCFYFLCFVYSLTKNSWVLMILSMNQIIS